MATPPRLIRDLSASGVSVDDIWDLVNAPGQHPAAIPVLLDWLVNINDRVPVDSRRRVLEAIVRALTVRAARPVAAKPLIAVFRSLGDPSDWAVRWAVGNALAVVADDSNFDEVSELVQAREYGAARQMVVHGLSRSKDPRAVDLLVRLLADDDVVAHAAYALGRRRAVRAREALAGLLSHPRSLVRREAKRALTLIDRE